MNLEQKAKLTTVSKHLATIGKVMMGIGIVGIIVNVLSKTMLNASLFSFDAGLAITFGGVGVLVIGAFLDHVFLVEAAPNVGEVPAHEPQPEMGGGEYEIVIVAVAR